MAEKHASSIRLGYNVDGALDVDFGRIENMLIFNSQADSYLFYLLQTLSNSGFQFELYDLEGQIAYSLTEDYGIIDVKRQLPSILSYEDTDCIISSRLVSEAFKNTLSLGDDEFLLLNSILQTLYKQNNRINLLQVVSSVRSYDSQESSTVERSTALRLDWRLYLINDLFLFTVKDDTQSCSSEQNIFDLSRVLSIEGRFLLLCLLLAKRACMGSRKEFQALYLSTFNKWAKAGVIRYIEFLRTLFPRTNLILASNSPFPENRVQFFHTRILDRESLECSKNLRQGPDFPKISEGELVYEQDDLAIPFFYEKGNLKKFLDKHQQNLFVEDKKVSDKRIGRRILEMVSKTDNITKTGIVQSLSIDFPTEMIEFVLEELISLDYIIAEVRKSRTGLSTKLSISMNGRSWLATEGDEK